MNTTRHRHCYKSTQHTLDDNVSPSDVTTITTEVGECINISSYRLGGRSLNASAKILTTRVLTRVMRGWWQRGDYGNQGMHINTQLGCNTLSMQVVYSNESVLSLSWRCKYFPPSCTYRFGRAARTSKWLARPDAKPITCTHSDASMGSTVIFTLSI